jgi:hypothetical protein
MRPLTQQEIDNAPEWADLYSITNENEVIHLSSSHEIQFEDSKPIPRKEFDISEYKPDEFDLFTVDCSGDVTVWLDGVQLQDLTPQDAIALAKHFKLTPSDLL